MKGWPAMNNDASQNGAGDSAQSLSEELKAESERLRLLAEKLRAREEALDEMERNYPYFKALVYRHLREEFERTVPPLTEATFLAELKEAVPTEVVMKELAQILEGK